MTRLSTFQHKHPRLAAWLSLGVLYGLLCLPPVVWLVTAKGKLLKALFYSAINLCLYNIPLVLFGRQLRWYVRSLALVAGFVPMVLVAARFGLPFDHEVVMYALDVGQVGGFAFLTDNLMALVAVPLLVITVCLCAELMPASVRPRQALSISGVSLALLLLLPISTDHRLTYRERVDLALFQSFPFNVPTTLSVLALRENGIASYETSKAPLGKVERTGKVPDDREIYVFVLGESQRFDHYGINGYERDTSPLLDKVPGLLSFQNVSAPAPATARSVPVLLSSARTYGESLNFRGAAGWSQPPSLQRVLSEASFKSVWLGTVPTVGTAHIDAFAHDSDDILIDGHLDGDTIEALRLFLKQNRQEKRLFVTLHLAGSHSPYGLRFPPTFNRFKPSSLTSYRGPVENLRNAYDNTILYSDFVLGQAISALQAEDACSFLMFVSDHGENLCDDGGDLRLHGGYPNRYTIQIPLFIWMSPKYKAAFPSIAAKLAHRVEVKISGANVFASFLDMARVSYLGWDPTRSFANHAFQEQPRLVSTGEAAAIDYDQQVIRAWR